MRLLFELSGEHPQLPFAELECVGDVTDRRVQMAVAECADPARTARLAMTHVVMEYLGECDASCESLVVLLKELSLSTFRTFSARVKKVHGTQIGDSQLTLERLIGTMIDGTVALKAPEEEYRLVCSGDRCYLGKVIHRIDRGGFAYRNPMRRPFFHPGVMMPIMARALVNISLVQPGELLFDPFCGTGGVLLEASLVGAGVLGGDADMEMISGCRRNLPGADLMRADATALPVETGVTDAVVTDLPYGQSVRIHGSSMERLYDASFGEIRRVLADGRRAVVVTHRDVTDIASNHFSVSQLYTQRVHKSLMRRIMILE